MATINIPEADANIYAEFISGKTVKLQAIASPYNVHDFDKGNKVDIAHLNLESQGIIVSDPVSVKEQSGKEVFMVLVRKN